MPIQTLQSESGRSWALWRITETAEALAMLLDGEAIPGSITRAEKRAEWAAGRLLLKTLLEGWGLRYYGLTKDDSGKPFLREHSIHISLTHSFPYAAALIDRHQTVGIDLEQPKEKLLRVAPRVLSADEVADAGSDVVKHCVYWCAKETLIKIHGKKDLTLSTDLVINPFRLHSGGEITGRIIVGSTETVVPLYYSVSTGFVLVFNR